MDVIFKRFISLIISCVIILIQPIPIIAEQDNSVKFINTVLCVSFDEDSNFINENMYSADISYTEKLFDMFDNTQNKTSLKSYINTISCGSMQIENVYPQYDGTSFDIYTMQHSKDYYTSSNLMVGEIVSNIKISSNLDIDGNNDGTIDNIIIIVDGSSTGRQDIIYPHKSDFYGYTINGLQTGTYNLYDSYSLFEQIISGKEGVIAHEFLHSLGYPDLYHYNDNKVPVGAWDIMAQNSIFLQYPLGYERYAISNWIDATTITEDKTLTLYPVSSNEGDILYLLKTPMSDKEVFAVEYRKQGSPYNGDLDAKIYGTGLIVYRVDTTSISNANGTNGIYVFRPNDTAVDACAGDLKTSFLSADSGRTSFGSSDLSATISDNAIVYADGSNSGIVISNVSTAGDTITFDVSFNNVSSNRIWETVGDTYILNSDCNDIDLEVVSDNDIYALCSFEDSLDVYSYNGTSWSKLGDSVTSMSSGYFGNAKISYCNGEVFVMYNDDDYIPKIKKYDASSQTWKDFYSVGEFAQYTEMTSYNGDIYITYTLGDFPQYSLNVIRINSNGESNTIAQDISTGVINPQIEVNSTGVYVSYRDISNGNILAVKRYNGSSWVDIVEDEISCDSVTMALNNDKILVAVSCNDGTTSIYEYDNSWSKLGDTFQSNVACDVSYNIDTPIVSIALDGKTKAYEYIEDSWSILGGCICDNVTGSIDLKVYENSIYGLILNTSNYPSLRIYNSSNLEPVEPEVTTIQTETTTQISETTEATTTQPVIDNIVSYNLTDLLKAKKISLGISTYNINLDTNDDNTINLLDILTIKRYLLNI